MSLRAKNTVRTSPAKSASLAVPTPSAKKELVRLVYTNTTEWPHAKGHANDSTKESALQDREKEYLHIMARARDGLAFEELWNGFLIEGHCLTRQFLSCYPGHHLGAEHFRGQTPGASPKPAQKWNERLNLAKARSRHFEIRASQTLVLAARPPLDDNYVSNGADESRKDRKWIFRCDNDIEKSLFRTLRSYLKFLTREEVYFADAVACNLPEKRLARIWMTWKDQARVGGYIKTRSIGGADQLERPPKPKGWGAFNALGFFIHVPKLGDYPCAAIASFAHGGWENLVFNSIVARNFRQWLLEPVFALVAMDLPLPNLMSNRAEGQYSAEDFAGALNTDFVSEVKAWPLLTVKINDEGQMIPGSAITGELSGE